MKTFGELVLVWDCLDAESVEQLNALQKPLYFRPRRLFVQKWVNYVVSKFKSLKCKITGKFPVPSNLNHLTIGEILVLSSSDDPRLPFELLFKFSPQQIDLLSIEDSIGFLNFIKGELKRINQLFEDAKADPLPEERQANIDQVGKSVGAFGLIDYIAKRCACSHEEAEKMPWQRVLAMMRIDRDTELFRRALQEVYTRKQRKR